MFIEQLQASIQRQNSLLCVGIDPLYERLPPHIQQEAEPFFTFARDIIDATHEFVCAYKPQIAYFAARGAEHELEKTIDYIKKHHPSIPVILDSKRGDIGSTAEQYAVEAFDRYKADAVTVNPYMGFDAAEPFLRRADKGVILLCRTSNPGAADFQDLVCGDAPLYEIIASTVATQWNSAGNCCLVVGATAPEQLQRVRKLVGDMPILVPGVGAQGGDVKALLQAGLTTQGGGLVINASRSIIYAGSGTDYTVDVSKAAQELCQQINAQR